MSAQDEHQRRKQHEVMARVLADTVVNQLVDSGCNPGQLIDFASEVVRCITDGGFARKVAKHSHGPAAKGVEVRPIRWRVNEIGEHRHELYGDRVTLRQIEASNAELLKRWREDRQISRTFSGPLLTYLLAHLPELSEDQRRRDFLVSDESGRGIGLVSLFDIDHSVSQAETAKLLGEPGARGKGYATEAVQLLLAYAFGVLKLRRVYLQTAGFNLHNIKLNETMGFKFEGILRESAILMGEHVQIVVMSMLAREFLQNYQLVALGSNPIGSLGGEAPSADLC